MWARWLALAACGGALLQAVAAGTSIGILSEQVDEAESTSSGLNGKIIGLGNGYGGESHGYGKVFDGETDTWFDCFGTDGIDIKSDCWAGLELPEPTTIGTIRFFPRGKCPG